MKKSYIKHLPLLCAALTFAPLPSTYAGTAPECLDQPHIWGYDGQSCIGNLMPICASNIGGSGNVRWDAGNNRQCRYTSGGGGGGSGVANQSMSSTQNLYGDPSRITDLIVSMGQSNAVGYASKNSYDGGSQDTAHADVYVWAWDDPTSSYRWMIANVRNQDTQTWIRSSSYGGISNGTLEGQSHGGFQIAKNIVNNTNRVVGIIPTGANGQAISFWNNGDYYNNEVIGRINAARSALSNPPKVGLVWWMQGEADDPSDLNGANTYYGKLTNLISRLSQNSNFWDSNNTMFVANHIGNIRNNTQINNAFDRLNSDSSNNAKTCSNPLRNSVRVDDSHFSAATLRRIGEDVGAKYRNPNSCESGGSTGGNTLVACKWGATTFPICPSSVNNLDAQGFGWNGSATCVGSNSCGPESWKTKIYQ